MQLEVGRILTGKVTGITKFGVFVDIGDGVTGMVHISEVASSYVKEIRDHVQIGQEARVKVLSVGTDGKVALSMKRTEETAPKSQPQQSFDEILSKFMQTSDEKISVLKKHNGDRRVSRRGGRS